MFRPAQAAIRHAHAGSNKRARRAEEFFEVIPARKKSKTSDSNLDDMLLMNYMKYGLGNAGPPLALSQRVMEYRRGSAGRTLTRIKNRKARLAAEDHEARGLPYEKPAEAISLRGSLFQVHVTLAEIRACNDHLCFKRKDVHEGCVPGKLLPLAFPRVVVLDSPFSGTPVGARIPLQLGKAPKTTASLIGNWAWIPTWCRTFAVADAMLNGNKGAGGAVPNNGGPPLRRCYLSFIVFTSDEAVAEGSADTEARSTHGTPSRGSLTTSSSVSHTLCLTSHD